MAQVDRELDVLINTFDRNPEELLEFLDDGGPLPKEHVIPWPSMENIDISPTRLAKDQQKILDEIKKVPEQNKQKKIGWKTFLGVMCGTIKLCGTETQQNEDLQVKYQKCGGYFLMKDKYECLYN